MHYCRVTLLTMLGPGSELIEAQERAWASATFSGARHKLHLRLPMASAEAPPPAALAALPDHEFDLSGQIVADCIVSHQRREWHPSGQWSLLCQVDILTIAAD